VDNDPSGIPAVLFAGTQHLGSEFFLKHYRMPETVEQWRSFWNGIEGKSTLVFQAQIWSDSQLQLHTGYGGFGRCHPPDSMA
jgi:hypothetical protein